MLGVDDRPIRDFRLGFREICAPGICALRAALAVALTAFAMQVLSAPYPDPIEGDAVIRDFRFSDGQVFPELKLHYRTLGAPKRDAAGRMSNAVLVLHGTGGSGASLMTDGFAGGLFGREQTLDATRYFIIIPDNIGHGQSSKPSDGLRARFPRYGYRDMLRAQRALIDTLGVDHLRLVLGTSMGGMHGWMWAVEYPDFMDAMLPLVCLPTQVSGRNRMERSLMVDAIRNDPEWNGGNYTKPPPGLYTALKMAFITGSSAKQLHQRAPGSASTDRLLAEWVAQRIETTDANDFLYAWDASGDYDPAPGLKHIRAQVTAVNFADDSRNPPELGILEKELARVPGGFAVTIPAGPRTRGHISFMDASLWMPYLQELLARSAR